jgi:hypothetical protein
MEAQPQKTTMAKPHVDNSATWTLELLMTKITCSMGMQQQLVGGLATMKMRIGHWVTDDDDDDDDDDVMTNSSVPCSSSSFATSFVAFVLLLASLLLLPEDVPAPRCHLPGVYAIFFLALIRKAALTSRHA